MTISIFAIVQYLLFRLNKHHFYRISVKEKFPVHFYSAKPSLLHNAPVHQFLTCQNFIRFDLDWIISLFTEKSQHFFVFVFCSPARICPLLITTLMKLCAYYVYLRVRLSNDFGCLSFDEVVNVGPEAKASANYPDLRVWIKFWADLYHQYKWKWVVWICKHIIMAPFQGWAWYQQRQKCEMIRPGRDQKMPFGQWISQKKIPEWLQLLWCVLKVFLDECVLLVEIRDNCTGFIASAMVCKLCIFF